MNQQALPETVPRIVPQTWDCVAPKAARVLKRELSEFVFTCLVVLRIFNQKTKRNEKNKSSSKQILRCANGAALSLLLFLLQWSPFVTQTQDKRTRLQ